MREKRKASRKGGCSADWGVNMEETEKEDSGSDLYLDTSKLLNTNGQQGVSVTDQYGIDVFSNRFETIAKQVEERQSVQRKEVEEQLFVTSVENVSDKSITEQLFGDTRSYFETNNDKRDRNDTIGYGIILLVSILATLIIIRTRLRKKGKHAGHYTRNRNRHGDEYQD